MKKYKFIELIDIAKSHGFYKNLSLSSLDEDFFPVVSVDYQKSNISNSVKPKDGVCFASSGTTGPSKVTFFEREEWAYNNSYLARMLKNKSILCCGDTVANLATPGHASFIDVHRVLNDYQGQINEISIGSDIPYQDITDLFDKFGINCIASIFSVVIGLASHYQKNNIVNYKVDRIVAGGEIISNSQIRFLKSVFPNAKVYSFLYGSTEVGLVGYNSSCDNPFNFHPANEVCHVEIVDPESGALIVDENQVGLLVVTNKIRTTNPVIRWSTGDLAIWTNTQHQEFKLLGRQDTELLNINGKEFCTHELFEYVYGLEKIVSRAELVIDNKKENQIEINICALDSISKKVINGEGKLNYKGFTIQVNYQDLDYFEEESRRKFKFIKDSRV